MYREMGMTAIVVLVTALLVKGLHGIQISGFEPVQLSAFGTMVVYIAAFMGFGVYLGKTWEKEEAKKLQEPLDPGLGA
jgi:hypothetical protein